MDGRRVETRMIERLDNGDWRFSAYAWNDEQSDATLVSPDKGRTLTSPGGRRYRIPSEADCRACHAGAADTGARFLRAAAFPGPRSARAARGTGARRRPRPARADRRWKAGRPAARTVRHPAADRGADARPAGRAGLPARQLRPVPRGPGAQRFRRAGRTAARARSPRTQPPARRRSARSSTAKAATVPRAPPTRSSSCRAMPRRARCSRACARAIPASRCRRSAAPFRISRPSCCSSTGSMRT